MPAPEKTVAGCGHESCRARDRGREAAGRSAYEDFIAWIGITVFPSWDKLDDKTREHFRTITDRAQDAWWDAWGS